MPIQKLNQAAIDLASVGLQKRYEASFAWSTAVSEMMFLPGLRGLWPTSSIGGAGDVLDVSGNGRTLTRNGATLTYSRQGLVPYADLTTATPDYLERADEAGLDILGTEAYISIPGITFGAWVRFDAAAAATERVIAKADGAAAANISYSLYRTGGGLAGMAVSNGAATETQTSGAVVMAANTWYHVAARWIPATDRSVFLNSAEYAAGASALAALNNTAAAFQVGGRDNGAGGSTENLDGRISLAFLCAAALSDATLFALYHRQRALFGV